MEFWRYNIAINENVLHNAFMYKCKKVVSCLTTCIFPDKTTYPIDETMLHNGPPHFSNLGYAYSKRMVDVQNQLYNQQCGCVRFTSVVPTNIYGAHDNYHVDDAHVIPGLIHRFYRAAQEKKEMVIWGSGKPLRQFIYAPDLAKLIVWAMRSYDQGDPIIMSTDEKDEITIKDVVGHIARAMKFPGKIVFDTTKADGQFKKTVSNAKLRKLYPDFQFTPIDKGVDESVKWFLANYAHVRGTQSK